MKSIINLKDNSLFREQCYLNGKWSESANKISVTNPATESLLGHVPDIEGADVKKTIENSDSAFKLWRSITARKRSKILLRWYKLIMEAREDLAIIMTAEQGKPLKESLEEIAYAASYIEWFAAEAERIYGDIIQPAQTGLSMLVTNQPIGVCGAITPWNFPSAMITRKAAPALAAGCTIIIRPASQTPFSALALAELADRAGFPPGVFNVITGNSSVIGKELTSNPLVRKISFTGSTGVGKLLMKQCAETVKKISLELGGNAPFIVFDDADMDHAVKGAVKSKFRNNGQTCICANRIMVQEGVYDEFLNRFTQSVKNMKIAQGFDKDAQLGPMINQQSVVEMEKLIEDALSKGAQLLTGGKRHKLGNTFFEPTVVGDITPQMRIAEEEIFGPIASVIKFKGEEDALSIANNTEYGLAAYIYTGHTKRIWRFSERLEYGMIAINTESFTSAAAPFGGIKQSGIGREGSKYGIDEYTEKKYICQRF